MFSPENPVKVRYNHLDNPWGLSILMAFQERAGGRGLRVGGVLSMGGGGGGGGWGGGGRVGGGGGGGDYTM